MGRLSTLQARLEAIAQPTDRLDVLLQQVDTELATIRMPLKQAAGFCGVSYETLRRWVQHGEIVAARTGGRWLVELQSVRARVARIGQRR